MLAFIITMHGPLTVKICFGVYLHVTRWRKSKRRRLYLYVTHHHHRHHHHHISVMQLGLLLTRSGLTYPEVSSKVYHDSFCQSDSSVPLPWVIYFEAFYLHVVSSFSCIPVICPKLVLFLTPLQFVHLLFMYVIHQHLNLVVLK